MSQPLRLERLRTFIDALAQLVDQETDEATLLDHGQGLLRSLVAHDDWLPEALAEHISFDPAGAMLPLPVIPGDNGAPADPLQVPAVESPDSRPPEQIRRDS